MENTLPFNPPAWQNYVKIGIGLALGAILFLLLFLAFQSQPQPVASEPVPMTLSEQLQTVYSEKTQARLTKSDLLVRQAGLKAQIQKVEADLATVNQTLTDLYQKEIDLSMNAVNSLETLTSTSSPKQ